jgi:hypothetical protein
MEEEHIKSLVEQIGKENKSKENKAKKELFKYLDINKENAFDKISLLLEIALDYTPEHLQDKIKSLKKLAKNEKLTLSAILETIKSVSNKNDSEKKGGEITSHDIFMLKLLLTIAVISFIAYIISMYREEEDPNPGGIVYNPNRPPLRRFIPHINIKIEKIAGACINQDNNVEDSIASQTIDDGELVIYWSEGVGANKKYFIFLYSSLDPWLSSLPNGGPLRNPVTNNNIDRMFYGYLNLTRRGGRRTYRKKIKRNKTKKYIRK